MKKINQMIMSENIKDTILKSKYASQAEVIVALLNRENVYISGPAGSGKSYTIRRFTDILMQYYPKKNIALTSTTGISALNINGQTVHSFFNIGTSKLPLKERLKNKTFKEDKAREVIKDLDILFIEEVSMLSAWHLQLILDIIKHCRPSTWHDIQFIVAGDFTQLPPVSVLGDDPLMGKLCYKSDAWKEIGFKNMYLDRVYRTEDKELKDILDKMSLNKIKESDLDVIEVVSRANSKKIPILCSTNKEVSKINKISQKKNLCNLFTINALIKKENALMSKKFLIEAGIEPKVSIKEGDVVMITRNDTDSLEDLNFSTVLNGGPILKNGMIGTISKIVDLGSRFKIFFDYEDPKTKKIFKYEIFRMAEWSKKIIMQNTKTKELYEQEIASFKQVPLKLAYAISIHKSQGQTYSHLLCDLSNCWTENLGYVALSRGQTIDGIKILENPYRKNISPLALKVSKESLKIKEDILKTSKLGTNKERALKLIKSIKELEV